MEQPLNPHRTQVAMLDPFSNTMTRPWGTRCSEIVLLLLL